MSSSLYAAWLGRPSQDRSSRVTSACPELRCSVLLGQADIAVVVPDDAQAVADQLLAERGPPQQQLGAQPHDQQDGWVVDVAHVLVVQLQVAGYGMPRADLHPSSYTSMSVECSRLTSTMKFAK